MYDKKLDVSGADLRPGRKMKKKETENTYTGFTLVEVVMVIIIIALVGMIAVPRVADTIRAMRFDTISDQLLNDLRFARRSAMDLNRVIRVDFTGGINYTVTVDDTEQRLRERTFPAENAAGWTITFGGSITNPLFFTSRGLPQNAGGNPVGGVINIAGAERKREFTIFTATGMIR